MNEIKVGEYVRTKDGYIRKVIQVNEKGSYEGICYGAVNVDIKYKGSSGISAKKIKSHSPNPPELVEVGDYVNGFEVTDIDYSSFKRTGKIYFSLGEYEICGDEIESIVTHEQFESMKYIVGGKEE